MTEARWLTPEAAARLLGVKEHHLPRLVKRGLVPAPSRHLGPRTPRYDRQALDSAMEGRQVSTDATISALAAKIAAAGASPRN